MISCQAFRATVCPGSNDADVLEHVRTCDACLDYALAVDPDFFFRSIGGGEMAPPGGVDNFVSDVMAQVRLRQTEGSAARRLPLTGYLRAAAAVLFVIASSLGIYRYEHRAPQQATTVAVAAHPAEFRKITTTKAVIETYQSQNATIVEVPAQPASDAKVVMIYDEALPADL